MICVAAYVPGGCDTVIHKGKRIGFADGRAYSIGGVRRLVTLGERLCYVLTLLKMHRPDCERCHCLPECWGDQLRKRLQDLNQRQWPKAESPKSDESERAAS